MHYGASLQGKMSNDGEKIALKLRLKHNPSADLILVDVSAYNRGKSAVFNSLALAISGNGWRIREG